MLQDIEHSWSDYGHRALPKIKRNDWLLADTCPQAANNRVLLTRVRKQPIIAFYFESENELKFITSRPGHL